MLPMVMTNPLEFRRLALEQMTPPPSSGPHHGLDIDLRDDSSTSSIRSSHVRQPQPPELPPTPTTPMSKDRDYPVSAATLVSHQQQPPNMMTLGMTTPATTPNRQRSSSLQQLQQQSFMSIPSPSSPLFTKASNQPHRNSLPLSVSTSRQPSNELSSSSAASASSLEGGGNVFNRLASASTRASRAKVHRLSY
jgi:hypothetical protein